VERALSYAGMTVKDLHLVEVIGGGFRVPGVRAALRKIIPEEIDLSTHVNGDEGMAFGAAFCAANVSSTFHVPRIATFQDAVPREVRLVLKGQDLDRDVPLFHRFALIEARDPTRQVIKFRHDKDFKVSLVEKKSVDDDAADAPLSVVAEAFEVTGFSGAMTAFGKYGEPKVHLTFTMDRNMMLNLASAEAKFEEEYEEAVKPANNSKANASESTEEQAAPVMEKKVRKHIFQLTVKRTDEDVLVKKMLPEAKLKAQKMLREMDDLDKLRARREEARNALEAFSFSGREKLESNEAKVKQVMDEESLEHLRADLSQIEDWIDDNKHASEAEFNEKRNGLVSRVDKIFHLIREHEERPETVKAFTSLLDTLVERRANWTAERPWIPDTVWKAVDKAQDDAKKWITDMVSEQAALTSRDEPVLSLASIRAEMEKIQRLVEQILKQRKPAPIKTPDEKAKSSSGDKKKSNAKPDAEKEGREEETQSKEEGENQEEKVEGDESAEADKEEL